MFSKPRKPVSLLMLEALTKRKALSFEEQYTLRRLSSGYQGEVKFASLLKKELHNACIPIFSLNLKVNGSECQLDNILIFENTIYLLDIKNFQGDYVIENNQWYSVATKKEGKNPLHQLKRGEIIFKDFLSNQSFQPTINASLVFVNQGFQLYQAPLDHPIIFPSQIHRFIDKLNNIPSQLNNNHETLAKQLMAAHIPKPKYEEIPIYENNQLKRGIVCKDCNGFMSLIHSRKLACQKCGGNDDVDNAVIRMIKEFHLLFPNEKISVRSIYQWCNQLIPESGVRRILSTHLIMIREGRSTYYILK